MKDISKQYALLTPDERFRLFVEAMGRQDTQELDHLENSCPRLRYTAQDHEYTRRKMRFTIYALASALDQLKTELLATTALLVALLNSDGHNEDAEAKALETFSKLMRLRDGKRAAWEQFCDQIGVDADGIASPFIGDLEGIMEPAEAALHALDDEVSQPIDDSDRIAAAQLEALTEAWTTRTG